MAALIARDFGRWSAVGRTAATYGALTALCLLPSVVWVQVYEGVPSYVRNSLASVAVEQARTELRLPALDWAAPIAGDSLLFLTYYAFWAVPVVAACVLVGRVALSPRSPAAPAERALATGLLVMGALVNMSFLRANLAERFGDAAAPIVLLAACAAGAASAWTSALARTTATLLMYLLLTHMLGAAYAFSEVARELDTSGLSDSWSKTSRRYQTVREELSGLPPDTWPDAGATGTMRAAGYVAQCTDPDDRLLVTGAIHEIPVLARRRFAAGQAMFKLSLYTSARDERRALARLEQQSVPVVLADAREFADGLVSDYPLIARHLAERYREVGAIAEDDEPRFLVFVEASRHPVRTYEELGLPCFR